MEPRGKGQAWADLGDKRSILCIKQIITKNLLGTLFIALW